MPRYTPMELEELLRRSRSGYRSGGGSGYGSVPVVPSSGPDIPVTDGLIAYWDWTGTTPYASQIGGHTLVDGSGSTVTISDAGPSGKAITLDGSSDYLVIAAASVRDLNIGATYGNACTVFAWVDRDETGNSFIAGCWQEDNNDPKRQYGLFVDLPTYGGEEQVCGHVSKSGGATPGYPFSRDYSANSRIINNADFEFTAFTYDGSNARSYLGPMFDQRPSYTDGLGNTYSKNPYPFTDGLNTTACDFTVGAVKLTAGMSNHIQGKIGPLAIYNRALSLAELTSLYRSYLVGSDPAYNFTFYTSASANARSIGWQCASASAVYTDGADAQYFGGNVAGSFQYVARGAATTNIPIVGWSPDLAGVSLSEITSVSFRLNSGVTNSLLRLVIKSGDLWYATDETFDLSVAGISGSDWTNAVVKTFTFDLTAAKWRDLTFDPGVSLSLAGSARGSDVPNGTLQNVGFYSPSNPSAAIRIDDLKVFT